MHRNQQNISFGGTLVLLLVMLNAFVLEQGLSADKEWYLPLFLTIPFLLFSLVYWRKAP
jgi:hypothetical protein